MVCVAWPRRSATGAESADSKDRQQQEHCNPHSELEAQAVLARLRHTEYVEPEPHDARVFELPVCALVPAKPARNDEECEPEQREYHQNYFVGVHRERAHHLTRRS